MPENRSNGVFDAIVIGGGSSGVVAAIAAAQSGARTCLVESSGYLGGTTYALGNVVTFHNNRMQPVVAGIPQKLVDRLAAERGVVNSGHLPNPGGMCGTVTLIDSATLNRVALEMMEELGVEVMLHSFVSGVLLEGKRIRGIAVVGKSGTRQLRAHSFIDASGDADVAVMAGASYERDERGKGLSATSVYRVSGVDHEAFVIDLKRNPHKVILLEDPYLVEVKELTPEYVMANHVRTVYDLPYIYLSNLVRDYIPRSDWPKWGITGTDKQDWGSLKPFGSRVHFSASAVSPEIIYVNTTNVHFDATDPSELSRAEIEGQRQVKLSLDILRRYIPGFANAILIGSMPKISVRASRRIIGDYQLRKEDVSNGARFPDSIAKGCYPMSVQSPAQPNVRLHLFVNDGGDYDIPYRSLLPQGIDGILVVGRCLSATKEASGSTRTGAQCMAYGHAAGVAAALSSRYRVTPRLLDVAEVRNTLRKQGAII